jgi:hypothetical protein
MPQIDAVEEADDITSALMVPFQDAPGLVVLESSLDGRGVQKSVRAVKARWPVARCIYLASDVEQRLEAEAAGADVALVEGFRPGKLVAAMVRLLPRPVA